MRLQYLGCRELGHGFVEHQVRLAGPAGAQAALVQGARRPSGQPRALGAKFAAGAKAAVRDAVRGCQGKATRVGFGDFRVMDELLALPAAGAAGAAGGGPGAAGGPAAKIFSWRLKSGLACGAHLVQALDVGRPGGGAPCRASPAQGVAGGGVSREQLSAAECVDADVSCAGWSALGECNRNELFMLRTCPQSCGVCGAAQARQCLDTSPHCPGWASVGECATNPPYMLTTCPNACGACDHLACVSHRLPSAGRSSGAGRPEIRTGR